MFGWLGSLELSWKLPEFAAIGEALGRERLLIGFDRRGQGASQREVGDLSLEAHVADLSAVVDHLQLERFDLFGLADGSAITMAYAAEHPARVSRLVLASAYSAGEDIGASEATRAFADLIRNNWGVARRALANLVFPSSPPETQRLYSNLLRETVSPEIAAKYMEFSTSFDASRFPPQVQAPTLVMHLRRDKVVPFRAGRAVAALIPNARFVALEGEYGYEGVIEIVRQFLDEGRSPAAAAGASKLATEDVHTILFTDVEGSTALTQRLGDAKARELLREHERIVREALKAHGGSEVKTMGDGFMASFSSATRALESAIAMQRAFAEHNESAEESIKVRIGLNAGEPIAEDDDLFGTAVNLSARICAHAEAGQILAPIVVRELAAGKQFMFADLGETELRGFEDPVRLYEVRWRADPTGAQASPHP
jgi:class 3 adenylate cyclase